MYNAYYNNMFNVDFIQRQAQQQYHLKQTAQIAECAHKLDDLLDGMEKIAPEYQSAALAAFCAVFIDHANRNTGAR